mmetsp:Transcript_57233/g.186043  ORF Transcript_57233/g.186043 Transcript_57233/m.186043 type:complete len:360 (-) Transcript_57233:3143-4222(-)
MASGSILVLRLDDRQTVGQPFQPHGPLQLHSQRHAVGPLCHEESGGVDVHKPRQEGEGYRSYRSHEAGPEGGRARPGGRVGLNAFVPDASHGEIGVCAAHFLERPALRPERYRTQEDADQAERLRGPSPRHDDPPICDGQDREVVKRISEEAVCFHLPLPNMSLPGQQQLAGREAIDVRTALAYRSEPVVRLAIHQCGDGFVDVQNLAMLAGDLQKTVLTADRHGAPSPRLPDAGSPGPISGHRFGGHIQLRQIYVSDVEDVQFDRDAAPPRRHPVRQRSSRQLYDPAGVGDNPKALLLAPELDVVVEDARHKYDAGGPIQHVPNVLVRREVAHVQSEGDEGQPTQHGILKAVPLRIDP